MRTLYALMHYQANTPIGLYDDPWAASIDFIEREEETIDPEPLDEARAVVSQTGEAIPLRRKRIVAALVDEADPSNVAGKHFVIYRYPANNGRPDTKKAS